MTTEALSKNIPVPGIGIKRMALLVHAKGSMPSGKEIENISFEKIKLNNQPVPLHKWIMPPEPHGYIKQKENDCL